MTVDALTIGSEPIALGRTPERALPAAPGASFAQEIGAVIGDANHALNEAETAARELAQGKADVVETMIALGRADVSLRMVVNLRNRMLESYQEIMRLQV